MFRMVYVHKIISEDNLYFVYRSEPSASHDGVHDNDNVFVHVDLQHSHNGHDGSHSRSHNAGAFP